MVKKILSHNAFVCRQWMKWKYEPFSCFPPDEKQSDDMCSVFWEASTKHVQMLLFATNVCRRKKAIILLHAVCYFGFTQLIQEKKWFK